mmetsp:Transcript_29103/g.37523  ORF Transcript_29103/g.37523 Transcript_29103/m.37523 type:complete len:91 (+) Transcript_29103:331-603(+)
MGLTINSTNLTTSAATGNPTVKLFSNSKAKMHFQNCNFTVYNPILNMAIISANILSIAHFISYNISVSATTALISCNTLLSRLQQPSRKL